VNAEVKAGDGELMADREGPRPKVIVAVPDGYHDLPDDERLAVAGTAGGCLAAYRRRPVHGLRHAPAGVFDGPPGTWGRGGCPYG
jgi:hypothetical protein